METRGDDKIIMRNFSGTIVTLMFIIWMVPILIIIRILDYLGVNIRNTK